MVGHRPGAGNLCALIGALQVSIERIYLSGGKVYIFRNILSANKTAEVASYTCCDWTMQPISLISSSIQSVIVLLTVVSWSLLPHDDMEETEGEREGDR